MKKQLIIMVLLFQIFISYSQGWETSYFETESGNNYGAIYALNENLVYVISNNGILLKTIDGGINWIEIQTGVIEDYFDMIFYNNDIGFAVGKNGVVIKTIDAGQNWTLSTTSTTNDLFSISINELNEIFIVGNNGTILKSIDFGDNWILDQTLTSERLNSISFKGNLGFFAGNNGTLYKTVDYGENWIEIDIQSEEDLFSISMTNNSTYFLSGEVSYYEYFGYNIYKSINSIDWVSNDVGIIGSSLGNVSQIFFQDDSFGFSFSSDCALCECCFIDIRKTNDGNQNWTESCSVSIFPLNSLYYSDIDFVSNDIGYVLIGNLILKTNDGGTSTEISLDINEFDFNQQFKIYPNPSTNNYFNIEIQDGISNNYSIEISNTVGKQIILKKDLDNLELIDVSILSKGVYFITLFKNKKVIARKKIIKND